MILKIDVKSTLKSYNYEYLKLKACNICMDSTANYSPNWHLRASSQQHDIKKYVKILQR